MSETLEFPIRMTLIAVGASPVLDLWTAFRRLHDAIVALFHQRAAYA